MKDRSSRIEIGGFLVVAVVCVVGLSASGCGSSGTSGSAQQELEAARREGEEVVREKARIGRLQHQVHHLQREMHRQGRTVVVEGNSGADAAESPSAASSVLRTFHAPSGNVSCEILSSGAVCSVESIEETFSFSNGEEAHTEPGVAVSRDTGELAPYGSTVSAGSITCSVPQSDEPRGITCSDGKSGHGFEASRVPDRQSLY